MLGIFFFFLSERERQKHAYGTQCKRGVILYKSYWLTDVLNWHKSQKFRIFSLYHFPYILKNLSQGDFLLLKTFQSKSKNKKLSPLPLNWFRIPNMSNPFLAASYVCVRIKSNLQWKKCNHYLLSWSQMIKVFLGLSLVVFFFFVCLEMYTFIVAIWNFHELWTSSAE